MTTFTARVFGRSHGRRSRLALPLVLAALSGLAVSGCDEGDATVAALERARLALNEISLPAEPVGGWEGSSDPAETALTKVVTDLRSISTEGSAGQKAAASLLMAQAQLGIGDRRAAYAALAEREALDALTPIRMQLDAMLSASSRASALVSYDPGATIEQLEGLIRSKDAEIAQRQRDRAQIEADILLLRQGAEERLAMAAGQRDEAARLAVAAMSLSAHDAGVQMERIHALRRQADAIELDGADLLARAEVRQPELTERELIVGQVTSQKAELVKALEATRQAATDSRAEAVEHAAEAGRMADEIAGLIQAAAKHRQDVADARAKSAIESYDAAATSARQAGADGYGLAGSAAQGHGDVLWLQAQNLGHLADMVSHFSAAMFPAGIAPEDRQALVAYANLSDAERARQASDQATAGLLERLAAGLVASPSAEQIDGWLDRLGTISALGEELDRQHRTALTGAAAAFMEARESFARVRGGDEAARIRVNRLTQLLDLCRQAANGRAIDLGSISDEPAEFNDAAEEPVEEEPAEELDQTGAEGAEPTGG